MLGLRFFVLCRTANHFATNWTPNSQLRAVQRRSNFSILQRHLIRLRRACELALQEIEHGRRLRKSAMSWSRTASDLDAIHNQDLSTLPHTLTHGSGWRPL